MPDTTTAICAVLFVSFISFAIFYWLLPAIARLPKFSAGSWNRTLWLLLFKGIFILSFVGYLAKLGLALYRMLALTPADEVEWWGGVTDICVCCIVLLATGLHLFCKHSFNLPHKG